MSYPRGATDEHVKILRKWVATPRAKRPRTLVGMAAYLGISPHVAKRAAYGQRAYAKVNP